MRRSLRRGMVRGTALGAVLALSVAVVATAQSPGASPAGSPGSASGILVGLVVKDLDNPFFVKMIEGAQAKAAELGIELQALAGADSADNEGQVQHIENLIAAGAKGILLTASDSKGIVEAVERAKEAGLLVIALDTQLDPPDAAQATFATDNRLAGKLIGQWAAAQLGDAATDAHVAFINDSTLQTSVDVQRNQGMMEGFGIDVVDPNFIGDETDPRIVGHEVSNGGPELAVTGMENLLTKDPDINVLHTINEPTAAGAYEALESAGKTDQVLIVSVDGGCPGVQAVKDGKIGATAMQFPLLMASLGVEAIAQFAANGTLPAPTEGLDFYNTGVQLITDKPVEGIESQDTTWGLENCWG